jgi:chromosome segregation ATPase
MDLARFDHSGERADHRGCRGYSLRRELRGIETLLTDMDSKIANLYAKIDGKGEAVEQHLTQTDDRLAETTKRLDLGLDQQADMSSKINKIDADLTFIHKRIDMLDQPKARGSNPAH